MARAHSGEGSEFHGEFGALLKKQDVKVTTTGGYDSNSNARAESRIKKLSRFVRAMLLEATGGSGGYIDLWGYCIRHHAGDKETDTTSTTGTAVFYNGALIEALSKRQTSTSLSSAEAEIQCLSMR